MATRRIKTNMRISEVRRLIKDIPGIIAGTKPDIRGIRKAFWSGVAYSVYGDIEKAFKNKSDLQTDELGDSWQDLSPVTKANRAALPGDLTKSEARNLKNYRTKGLLNAQQTKAWKAIYNSTRARLIKKGIDQAAAGVEAAKIAWAVVKSKHGGVTRKDRLGNRKIPVLNEFGKLALSVSQGEFNGVNYVPPTRQQIFRIERDRLVLGTKDKKASRHHRGIPGRLPTRRLWPNNIGPWVRRGVRVGTVAATTQVIRSL